MESSDPPRRLSSISPISPLSSQLSFPNMTEAQNLRFDHELAPLEISQDSAAALNAPMPHPPPVRLSRFLEAEDTMSMDSHGQRSDPNSSPRTLVADSPVPSMGNISRLTTPQGSSDEANKKFRIHASSDSASDDSSRYSPTQPLPRSFFDPSQPYASPNPHLMFTCPTRKAIVRGKRSKLLAWLLLLSVGCTVASTTAVCFAHKQKAYAIGKPGQLSLATATSICAVLAKFVEITLVTLVVANIGQALTRRLISQENGVTGVSIAEMNMRAWMTQPGSTWNNLTSTIRLANTFLGFVTLWTTIVALLYTTAAEALIYPKLRMNEPVQQNIYGTVETPFANHAYMKQTCNTPIIDTNAETRGTACLHISFAGQSFHNFQNYLSQWSILVNERNETDMINLESRPPPEAVFDIEYGAEQKSAIAVTGQWLMSQSGDITGNSTNFGRFVQNVTMAMPHINVAYAARDPSNHITQPEDLGGAGEYNISAAVPAPALHVLCAGLTNDEAATFVKRDADDISDTIQTAVDDVFNFGTDITKRQQLVPRFEGLPKEYQTSVNNGTIYPYGTQSAATYLLGMPPTVLDGPDYVLCAIRASQYPHCTTRYHVADAGSQLTVHCDDEFENDLPYSNFDDEAVVGQVEPNFQDVAEDWIMATALNGGVADMKAQSARLLMQMIPALGDRESTGLSRWQPSIAESLAVLAARPLLMSTVHTPFVPFWNYTAPDSILPGEGQRQYFNALVSMREYKSGPVQSWQRLLFAVLWSAVFLSLGSAAYVVKVYTTKDGLITDFTEPHNLFALAMNSPASVSLRGACGAGPKGDEWQQDWKIRMHRPEDRPLHSGPGSDLREPHFYLQCLADEAFASGSMANVIRRKPVRRGMRYEYQQVGMGESPAMQQFDRLSKSSGSLPTDLMVKIRERW